MIVQNNGNGIYQNNTKKEEATQDNTFAQLLNKGQNNETQNKDEIKEENQKMSLKEYKEYLQKLVDDIESVMKTGYTKEELKALEEMLKNLRKLRDEYNENPSSELKKKIEDMVSAIEQMIAKMKEKGGLANINFDNILETIKHIKEFDTQVIQEPSLQTLDILKGV